MASETPLSDVRFLTVAEVALIMRVSKMTVYRLVHSGELEAIRGSPAGRISPEMASQTYTLRSLALGRQTGGYDNDDIPGDEALQVGVEPPDPRSLRTALAQHIPVAIVLAGGYAQSVEDTITIHANTAAVAKDVLEKAGGRAGWRA